MSKSRRGRSKKNLELNKTLSLINLELLEKEFSIGEHVYYIPKHLINSDLYLTHPEVESGIISSMNDRFIFVRFFSHVEQCTIGFQETGKACSKDNLFPMSIRDTISYFKHK